MIGCNTPRSRIESASAVSEASSKRLRGWDGLVWMILQRNVAQASVRAPLRACAAADPQRLPARQDGDDLERRLVEPLRQPPDRALQLADAVERFLVLGADLCDH